MAKRKRYRYILRSLIKPDDLLSCFRLFARIPNYMPAWVYIRVEIPQYVELKKLNCNPYSTTNEDIQLRDLNPVVYTVMERKVSKKLTKFWLEGQDIWD